MMAWAEIHIGVVYYVGLTIVGAILAIVGTLLARRLRAGLSGLEQKHIAVFWRRAFGTTIVLLTFVAALSVKFYSCSVTDYQYLVDEPADTIWHGLEQVATGLRFLAYGLVGWLLAFTVMYVVRSDRRVGSGAQQ